MLSPLVSSRLGMSAAMAGMQVAAHNIANASVEGFRRQRAEAATGEGGGVEVRFAQVDEAGPRLEADLVGLMASKHAYLANLAVFRRAGEALGTLLDARA